MKTPNHARSEAGHRPHSAGANALTLKTKSRAVAAVIALAMVLAGCAQQPATGSSDPVPVETSTTSSISAEADSQATGTATISPPSTSVEPGVQLMEQGQFWDIISRSLEVSDGSIERQAAELEDILADLPPVQVASFNARFVSKNLELYSWELWGAAYVLYGGCSDDCFEYLRSWVVGQGQDYFKAVQRDPHTLDNGRLSFAFESDEAEWLSYVGEDAYLRASDGRDLYEDYPQSPSTIAVGEPSGTAWDEETVESLYPDLSPLP